ncbi:DUF6944 family repetitive protein [Bacillus sp. CHD6a]|uniref:DUF6944 family repetitive protein n=1 Tax=Bacillus sp. CHD6a TaxID=1643452 RepID=UPI0006CD017B|nr:hypothetical protein [Bacillus sp. CHD6a]KPB04812.1 hypothetical protein AAV98_10935 [Bacillus sp. CHD6a]
MGENTKQFIGVWTQALGTVITAIGSTPTFPINEQGRTGLSLVGNVLQAGGNGLEADSQEELTYGKLGNIIQATGNLSVSTGLVIDFEGETEERLVISGDFIQALGAITALGSASQPYMVVGNFLQAIGNSIQAVGGSRELRGETTDSKQNEQSNEAVIALGSWLQALGTIILALGLTYERIE